jgi:hypothetical protein
MAIDKETLKALENSINIAEVHEKIMLMRILEHAKRFYEKPENRQAYEVWLNQQDKK